MKRYVLFNKTEQKYVNVMGDFYTDNIYEAETFETVDDFKDFYDKAQDYIFEIEVNIKIIKKIES